MIRETVFLPSPSYVAFNDTECFIDYVAEHQIATNANNTVFDAKHLIGRRYTDPVVQSDKKQHLPFTVINESDGNC